MKEIIHNIDNLSENDITETVTRIKALLINGEDIMIGYSDNVYHFPGGHLEENEKFSECLKREIMEECGIEIEHDDIKEPIMYASQLCKDYPEKGKNRKSEIYYYVINTDKKPNIEKTNLTEQEIKGNFEIRTIPLKNSIEELKRNIPNNKRNESITPDMIEAIKEYFRLTKENEKIVKSKEWNWEKVKGKQEEYWKEPSIESFYLINRWKKDEKKDFLDLGCGLGRHTILFAKNGFNTKAFDLSENAIKRAKEYANKENVDVEFKLGDMLNLPYDNESLDCILCRNVISHTNTEGMRQIVKELYRVLRNNGEVYLTLGSKETWGFKQTDWPLVDPNTRVRMDEGPEKGIPHFYADYNLIQELFKSFNIENIYQLEDFYKNENNEVSSSKHYHVLIKKIRKN